MKKRILLGLQILLSAALLGWVISLVPAGSWQALAAASLQYVAVALVFMVGNLALSAFRLYRLLWETLPEAKFSLIFKSTWLGYFCSSFLPSSVGGDIVKLAWLSQSLDNGPTILASMVVERVLSLGVTLVIAFVFFVSFTFRLEYAFPTEQGMSWLLASGVAGLVLCCAIGMWAVRSQHRYATLLRAYVGQTRDALRYWHQNPKHLLEAIFWSMAVLAVGGLGVLLPIVWTAGGDISALHAIGCIAVASVISLIPVAINGIGIYEVGVVGLLTILGVPESNAAQAAILLRLVMIIAALPGAYWLRFSQHD